ncbi:hypothetical protein M413DRAFT_68391 [Hebeloma cylindrosporum]|uniref:Nuclear pore complex protein n=1 Tax=Hebeloma cylindrosporum TaxID=76867 RepID=A0A0C2YSG1_HEBCY|nr:hypothetical protein M413DRAFT_68391 [Hebeloma cylindrosporum h7]
MSDGSLYSSCADVLSVCQTVKDDLLAVLDPDTGYAPRMRQICHELIDEFEDRPDSRNLQTEIEILRLEENTWGLLQALMSARKTETPLSQSAKELLVENPYTPTSTLVQAIMDSSPVLTELIVVREWLQETAPAPSPPEANTGYWKFTKHTIMQSLRTGHAQRDGMVTEMDPDAVNRGNGAALAADDTSYEKTLLQALYGYIRAGRLEDAVEVCRRAHQPWRAASLRGSLLFQWRALSTARETTDEDDLEPEVWSGNRNRQLWKQTCIRAALSPSLSDQERLLYASIVPSPQTTSVLKSACRTWEDHLWADISVLCEEKVSSELRSLASSSFWEGGQDAVDVVDMQGVEDWEGGVGQALSSLKSVAVVDGPAADHPFHVSQLYVILDQLETLFNMFANGLQDGAFTRSSFEYESICRFSAHLCLFLQMIEVPIPPEPVKIILESYLAVLEDAGQRDLIALYAGALGENAVARYASFLVSLGLSVDINERRLALTRASEHGLNVERVAIVTAERTIEKVFSSLPPLSGTLPSIINLQPPPDEAETLLLRSIEWTTFAEATYDIALEQATVILRYFLTAGRIQAAQDLLVLLPPELASIDEPEAIATEYLHYRQFFLIWEGIARVVEWEAKEVEFGADGKGRGTTAARDARDAWVSEYSNLIDQTYDNIVRLFTTEWLAEEEVMDDALKRQHERARIRQIYVPELIIRLHYLLYTSRKYIPGNLKRAIQLANIVADSRYRLYETFSGNGGRSLLDYLQVVRQAVLAGLENGGSDPFRIISAL